MKSQARLNDFTFAFHFHALEKEMAAHSSVLAWRIPEWAPVYGVAQSWIRLKRLSSSRPESDSRLPKPLRFELFRASVFFSGTGGIISSSGEEMKAC